MGSYPPVTLGNANRTPSSFTVAESEDVIIADIELFEILVKRRSTGAVSMESDMVDDGISTVWPAS